MKKTAVLFVMVLICVSSSAGIGGTPAHQGKITSIQKTDKVYVATVRMDSTSSTAKEAADKVKPGMSVRIIYSIDTSEFRLPIGRVIQVQENGDVVVGIDESLLARDVTGPNSDQPVKVAELFKTGAAVSISNEGI